jgi:hypothetical protein
MNLYYDKLAPITWFAALVLVVHTSCHRRFDLSSYAFPHSTRAYTNMAFA